MLTTPADRAADLVSEPGLMRRACLGWLLLVPVCVLAACSADTGDFLADTATYRTNPNAPIGDSETMRRARGLETVVEPLRPEPGDVWPSPVQLGAPPTLRDLEQNPSLGSQIDTHGIAVTPPSSPSTANAPERRQPRPASPPGSTTGPGSAQPGLPPAIAPDITRFPATPPAPPEGGQPVSPSSGPPGVTSGGTREYRTLGVPGEGQGIVVPNGNGTSTLIKPDGTVTTIPSAK